MEIARHGLTTIFSFLLDTGVGLNITERVKRKEVDGNSNVHFSILVRTVSK